MRIDSIELCSVVASIETMLKNNSSNIIKHCCPHLQCILFLSSSSWWWWWWSSQYFSALFLCIFIHIRWYFVHIKCVCVSSALENRIHFDSFILLLDVSIDSVSMVFLCDCDSVFLSLHFVVTSSGNGAFTCTITAFLFHCSMQQKSIEITVK